MYDYNPCSPDSKNPRLLSVSWFYWADVTRNGQRVKLERAFLNGQHRETLLTTTGRVTDMAIDLAAGRERLLWAKRHEVFASDLRGKNRVRLFARPGWSITGIDVYGAYIYFAEATTKSVYRMRKVRTITWP